LLAILEEQSGLSFRAFTRPPLVTMLHQESRLSRFPSPQHYVEWLRQRPAEGKQLALRLLNRSTRFFRDPEVFDFLKDRVLRPLVESRSDRQPIRIWVAGCATGEEAYSVAISVAECLQERGLDAPVRIFATDVSPLVLRKARAGAYPAKALAHVSPERVAKYFQRGNGDYVISRPIRNMCRFARHDLASHPALYGRLDLVTCRNVLLYFTRRARADALRTFHQVLKPGGCLLLGTAETADGGVLFRPIDPQHQLFRKVPELRRG
jgi:two-component system CheB/CheR fusion protein